MFYFMPGVGKKKVRSKLAKNVLQHAGEMSMPSLNVFCAAAHIERPGKRGNDSQVSGESVMPSM